MKHIAIVGECMIELNGKPFGSMHQTLVGILSMLRSI